MFCGLSSSFILKTSIADIYYDVPDTVLVLCINSFTHHEPCKKDNFIFSMSQMIN